MPAAPVFPAVSSAPARVPDCAREPFLGVLMLQTRFPRLPGDIGHPGSFGVPTRHLVVHGAAAAKVVQDAPGLRASGLLPAFVDGAQLLAAQGAAAITTSCGFLVLFQRELQQAVTVPLVTSSLVMLPDLLARERRVGVLTISAQRLGPEHLQAAGVPRDRWGDVPIEGMPPDSEFVRCILGDRLQMDVHGVRCEVVAAARQLKDRAPDVHTVVLECTNLPPHAPAIEEATGLRTLSLLQCAALRRPFSGA